MNSCSRIQFFDKGTPYIWSYHGNQVVLLLFAVSDELSARGEENFPYRADLFVREEVQAECLGTVVVGDLE